MPARSLRAGIIPMSARCAAILLAASLVTGSCSEKSAPVKPEAEAEKKEAEKKEAGKEETEERPHEDEMAEDCVAFLRATKIFPKTATDCAGCSAEGTEILAFRQMRMDRISCSADTCEVAVTLRAVFNPAPAGTITGGLTAWISQEQRLQYLNGHPPEGEQVYRVKITYRRTGEGWRAIEFDRADSQ
jgi:hypothetical protein